MKRDIGYTDTLTGKEYRFGTWGQMAAAVVHRSEKEKYGVRLLPLCSGYNLDYHEKEESVHD